MKKIFKSILHSSIIIASTPILFVGSTPLALSMIPVLTILTAKLIDDFSSNYINDSIFSVSRHGKISQNSISKPTKLLKFFKNKDKNKIFLEESANMFSQLKQNDNNGNLINYSTVSHAKTISLLKRLQRNGYIDNLSYEKKKKSRLFFEKLLIGNTKNLFNNKKSQMYNISFNLTDKKRYYNDLINIYETNSEVKVNEVKFAYNSNNKSNEIREKIRLLENYKEELEQSKYGNNDNVTNEKRSKL